MEKESICIGVSQVMDLVVKRENSPQIASVLSELGMTERAVEGKLYRLKKRLRKMLGGEGYD